MTRPIFAIAIATLFLSTCFSQEASIKEEIRTLQTYPFHDPNPIPILTSNPKIYPYFRFDGYSHTAKKQDWKIVKLENDYIEVYVLPEVGGKVWGAIEKASGKEFIYRNEVMKFRNIAMRGPWTSGGIEFNFGIIGHTPATATPVDYITQEHADGSVSVTVGMIDLPSRTQWRVQVKLDPDKAYFETKVLWDNPSPLHQAYYNWMTGAAVATDDLEFYTPGNQYLKHSGEALPWPNDNAGRNLSHYGENTFSSHKSYHVVGQYNDFFGGYYRDSGFGFGHWSTYEEMPGQKLWLWAQSRQGGIWEDLLTDTDGQYIEFQAGRLFVQYSPGSHDNPISQANFSPYTADQWTERWFPVKKIGGLSDVSPQGVLHVSRTGDQLKVGVFALADSEGELLITSAEKVLAKEVVQLSPTKSWEKTFPLDAKADFEINLESMDLAFSSNPEKYTLKRPFQTHPAPKVNKNSAEYWYRVGIEAMKFRAFDQAQHAFHKAVNIEPRHLSALTQLGELYYRRGAYQKGLEMINLALQVDAYDAQANYTAGILYRAQNDVLNALEHLGWAARSMAFRSGAYAQMAELYLVQEDWAFAKQYAEKSLQFNTTNQNALRALSLAARALRNDMLAHKTIEQLLEIDPLSHFAHWEKDRSGSIQYHRSEFPEQTVLELAIYYEQLGFQDEAKEILEMAPKHPLIQLWQAHLNQQAVDFTALSLDFLFPYRLETLALLFELSSKQSAWQSSYLLALNLWAVGRAEEAKVLLESAGESPDFAPFYASRAHLTGSPKDLERAMTLDPDNWRYAQLITQYFFREKEFSTALDIATKAYQKFPDNYSLGMELAKCQLLSQQFDACLATMKSLQILPFEGASEAHKIYELAHIGAAIKQIQQSQYASAIELLYKAKEWPESLGVGKPYQPDERLIDYWLGIAYAKQNHLDESRKHQQAVIQYTQAHLNEAAFGHLLGLHLLHAEVDKAAFHQAISQIEASRHKGSTTTQWVFENLHKEQENKPVFYPGNYAELEQHFIVRALRE